MRRDFLILFLLPVVSMSQTENSFSTNACEAGAEIRSRATSGMSDRAIVSLPPELYRSLLRSAGQIHRVLRQVVHHCVARRVTATPVALSASLAARCGNAEDRICNCRSVSNTQSSVLLHFAPNGAQKHCHPSLLITKSKLTILANFLVIVSFLDCNFSYYLVLVTNLFGIIVIVYS